MLIMKNYPQKEGADAKMKKNNFLFNLLAWGLLIFGMGVFLFTKETTIVIRISSAVCCVTAGVLFEVGRRRT